MKKLAFLILITIITMGHGINAQNKTPKFEKLKIEMFPTPQGGFKQLYIQVPIEQNEDNLKVEIFAGKTEMIDCNTYFMNGTIKDENLEGWGYNYYTVNSEGVMARTKKACMDNKKTSKFIHIQPQLFRYNSKLPIVIYVPENLEIKYRIWRADKSLQNTKKNASVKNTK